MNFKSIRSQLPIKSIYRYKMQYTHQKDKMDQDRMGCSTGRAEAEVQPPAGVNLYKNPGEAGDSPVFRWPRDFLAYPMRPVERI